MKYPWARMLLNAMDMGFSADEFWRLSPRAVWILTKEVSTAKQPEAEPVKLDRLPRP